MLNRDYFDSLVAYFIGRSSLSWYSKFIQDYQLKQGVFLLREVLDETDDEVVLSDPVLIFAGCELEIKDIGGGVRYLVVDWQYSRAFFTDGFYIYLDSKKYRYQLNVDDNLDEILRSFIFNNKVLTNA
ncbi:MAG: hypothetical protein ACPLXO_03820 [Desulfurella sp.]